MYRLTKIPALFLLIGLALAACSSKYTHNLYLTTGEERSKVKVTQTEYIPRSRLAPPYARAPIVAGDRQCVVLTTRSRGKALETKFLQEFMGFDEYLACRVYLEFPELRPDSIPLQNHGYVHVLGRYDLPAENKVFVPESGFIVVDTVDGRYVIGTVEGDFVNRPGQRLTIDGRFRTKVTR